MAGLRVYLRLDAYDKIFHISRRRANSRRQARIIVLPCRRGN
jgi:hypothetical protein